MLDDARRVSLVLCAFILAACAAQTPAPPAQHEARVIEPSHRPEPPPPEQRVPPADLSASPAPAIVEDQIVVTGSRVRGQDYQSVQPISPATGIARERAPYAQTAPQPPPGSIDRERYANLAPNPIRITADEPVSTFSIDVDTASYSNVRRMLNAGRLPPRDAVRTEELINYFRYDYPPPRTRTQPFATHVTVLPSPWAEGRQLVHIGLQGYAIATRQRPPLNLTLLIDVSGSMRPENKLPLAVQGFRMLTEQLNARDRISIVVYAGAAGAVLEPTPGSERGRILSALDNLRAGGSTAGGEGLALAYALAARNFDRNAVNRVIIATDGDFNVGIADPQQLQDFISHQRESGIYLSVLGFGGGNYNDALMQRLAQNGNGTAAYIDTLNEARRVLRDEIAANLFPIANDVKIQVEFNPARVAEYRLIGYETRMLRREDFNNDQVDAGDIGAGHAVTAIYEITPVGGPTFTEPLRYQQRPPQTASTADELGFLRIRYKLPGQTRSRLIERPISDIDAVASIDRAPEYARWATAVAGYGQLLRGDPYLAAGYAWADVTALAEGARGRDEFGWRAEFVQLTRAAEAAAAPRTAQNTQAPPR